MFFPVFQAAHHFIRWSNLEDCYIEAKVVWEGDEQKRSKKIKRLHFRHCVQEGKREHWWTEHWETKLLYSNQCSKYGYEPTVTGAKINKTNMVKKTETENGAMESTVNS